MTGGILAPPRARPRARRAAALLMGALGLAAVVLAAGFLFFVLHAAGVEEAEISPAAASGPGAGIAVLTGGPDRVETGLALLLARPGERLIVSGVAAEAALPDLARLAGLEPAAVEARTAVGHEATSTRGNAREVAASGRSRW